MNNLPTLCYLHGFNEKQGSKLRLQPTIEQEPLFVYPKLACDYGYFGLWDVITKNRKVAKKLASEIPQGSVLIGHSNGCAISKMISDLRPDIKHLIFINPAVIEDIEFSPNLESVLVLHNKCDLAVMAAKWTRILNKAPFNWAIPKGSLIWGRMGRYGYRGNDARVTNVDVTDMCTEFHHVKPHEAAVMPLHRERTARIIAEYLSQYF